MISAFICSNLALLRANSTTVAHVFAISNAAAPPIAPVTPDTKVTFLILIKI
jgi:hypothetical protein